MPRSETIVVVTGSIVRRKCLILPVVSPSEDLAFHRPLENTARHRFYRKAECANLGKGVTIDSLSLQASPPSHLGEGHWMARSKIAFSQPHLSDPWKGFHWESQRPWRISQGGFLRSPQKSFSRCQTVEPLGDLANLYRELSKIPYIV